MPSFSSTNPLPASFPSLPGILSILIMTFFLGTRPLCEFTRSTTVMVGILYHSRFYTLKVFFEPLHRTGIGTISGDYNFRKFCSVFIF